MSTSKIRVSVVEVTKYFRLSLSLSLSLSIYIYIYIYKTSMVGSLVNLKRFGTQRSFPYGGTTPEFYRTYWKIRGPGSSVGIATGYGLDGPGIESRCGRDFPHLSRPALQPTQPPVQWIAGVSRGKERPERDADPSPTSSAVGNKEYSSTSTPPMSRTACTEPQCLYRGALYRYL